MRSARFGFAIENLSSRYWTSCVAAPQVRTATALNAVLTSEVELVDRNGRSLMSTERVRTENDAPVRQDGEFVLYWMVAQRRTEWNFALQRAAEWARRLNRPLLVLEALRCDYPWASDRLHRFVVEGMADNARRLEACGVGYYSYIEDTPGAGRGLLAALAQRSCVVITDDYPAFFVPRMVAAAAEKLSVLLESVDSNGLLPLRATDKAHKTAHSFRRHLQRSLVPHLRQLPQASPLQVSPLLRLDTPPAEIRRHWPDRTPDLLRGAGADLSELPLDHDVPPTELRGGAEAARRLLRGFLEERLSIYDEERNQPQRNAASGLSPYLHFGHISAHQVFAELAEIEDWDLDRLSTDTMGSRRGWWGMSGGAEAFLDQLVTWRELGFNMCVHRTDYDRYESLPDWAKTTLAEHAVDRREHVYGLDEFEAANTDDELWNAAQTQLRREGRIHNYLRMLWGKKILEWSATPEDALEVMIELNNKYALDGRDPNSYSGIFWCLGRYDRAWGPERPVLGKIRFMSSANTARKFRVADYVRKYTP
jgi:deoxyribodipyrimidine photo-lyase